MRKSVGIALTAGLSLTCLSPAAIVSNLHGDIFTPEDSITPNNWRAFEFRVGVSSIILGEVEGRFIQNSAGLLSAWIYSDDAASNAPGAILGALDAGDFSTSFTASLAIALTADTDYWFVVGGSSVGADYTWQFSDTNAFISFPDNPEGFSGTGSEVSQAISSDGGVSWGNVGGAPAWYAIEVRAVPEPSSMVMLSLGVLGIVLRRSRGRSEQGVDPNA